MTNSNSVIVACVLKDSSKYLTKLFNNFKTLNNIFHKVHFIFVENNSADNTKEFLKNFSSENPNTSIINLDGLNFVNKRTKRLEIARNNYLNLIKNTKRLRDYDYLLILDMDEINENLSDFTLLKDSIRFLNSDISHAAIFPNQIENYYDLWALRHPKLCPKDIFFDLAQLVFQNQKLDQSVLDQSLIKSLAPLRIEKTKEIFEVDSAFGGLGLYKLNFVLKNSTPYIGTRIINFKNNNHEIYGIGEVCEHVSFNSGIKNLGGKLFINPSLINNNSSNRIPLTMVFANMYTYFNDKKIFDLEKKS